MAPGVAKSYVKNIAKILSIRHEDLPGVVDSIKTRLKKLRENNRLVMHMQPKIIKIIKDEFNGSITDDEINTVLKLAYNITDDDTHQAMEAVIHNLNSMHSRAGKRCCVPELWETLGVAN